jgi:hypothetical protein
MPIMIGVGVLVSGGASPLGPVVGTDSSSFTRADGAGLPDTDQGRTWTAFNFNGTSATLGISSNQVCVIGTGTANPSGVYVDVGATNITAQATLAAVNTGVGIVISYADANNFVYATQSALSKIIGGAFTSVGSYTAFTAGQVMKVTRSGTTFTVYKDGASVTSQTIADAGVTGTTKTGIFIRGNDTTSRIDDWSVVTP